MNCELKDYSLEHWAKQNILLLNSALTVEEKKPSSHIKLWSPFTEYILTTINNDLSNVIFVAWGAHSHNLCSKIKIDSSKHHLLISSHPSPLSAYKKYKNYPSFLGSKVFSNINNILKANNEETIDF